MLIQQFSWQQDRGQGSLSYPEIEIERSVILINQNALLNTACQGIAWTIIASTMSSRIPKCMYRIANVGHTDLSSRQHHDIES